MSPTAKLKNDNEILLHLGVLNNSSFNRVLYRDGDDEGAADDELETIQHSSYYSTSTLINELADKKDSFNILSLNCGSINAKIDSKRIQTWWMQLPCNLFTRNLA